MKKNIVVLLSTLLSIHLVTCCMEQEEKDILQHRAMFKVTQLRKQQKPDQEKFTVGNSQRAFQFIPNTSNLITERYNDTFANAYYTIYTEDGQQVRDLKAENISGGGSASDDGTQFVCAGYDPHGSPLFDIETGQVVKRYGTNIHKESNSAQSAHFGPEGCSEIWVTRAYWQNDEILFNILCYDHRTGEKVRKFWSGLNLSRDRKSVASVSHPTYWQSTVEINDTQTDKQLGSKKSEGNMYPRLHPTEATKFAVTWIDQDPYPHYSQTLRVYDYPRDSYISEYNSGRPLWTFGWNFDGSQLVVGEIDPQSNKPFCSIVDPKTGKRIRKIDTAGKGIYDTDTRKDGTLGVISDEGTPNESNGIIQIFNLNKSN